MKQKKKRKGLRVVGRVKGEKQLWREEIEMSQVGGEERRICEGKWSVVETEQLEEGEESVRCRTEVEVLL